MDKQNIVCSYNEVLTSHKKNEVESCYTMDVSWKLQSKIRQLQKAITMYFMILFIWNVIIRSLYEMSRQIHRDGK